MSEQKGTLVMCDRCTENKVFLKCLGEVGTSNYEGPGTRQKYEALPKTWMYIVGLGHLCPRCAQEFASLIKTFFGEEKYKTVAPCFRIEGGDK